VASVARERFSIPSSASSSLDPDGPAIWLKAASCVCQLARKLDGPVTAWRGKTPAAGCWVSTSRPGMRAMAPDWSALDCAAPGCPPVSAPMVAAPVMREFMQMACQGEQGRVKALSGSGKSFPIYAAA
jgi:hypothetical protein